MTLPDLSTEDRETYEAVFGVQPEWHEPEEPEFTPPPDVAALLPGATPEAGALSDDEVTYQSLFGK